MKRLARRYFTPETDVRVLRTFIQSVGASFAVAGVGVLSIDWPQALSLAGATAFGSLAMSMRSPKPLPGESGDDA